MRRVKPSAGLSSQQLKHFAVAAVAITLLLALFASGADWGASAQVKTVEAKNRLIEAEAQKLGTRKITSSMAVNRPVNTGFGEVAGPSAIDVGGGGGSVAPAPAVVRASSDDKGPILPPPGLKPGQTYTVSIPASGSPATGRTAQAKQQSGPVSQDQAKAISDVSRQRAGSPDQGD